MTGLISISSLLIIRGSIKEEVKTMTEKTLELYMKKLDLQFNDIRSFTVALTVSNELQSDLKLLESSSSQYKRLRIGKSIKDYLFLQQSTNSILNNIVVFSNQGEAFSASSMTSDFLKDAKNINSKTSETNGELTLTRITNQSNTLVLSRVVNTINNNYNYHPLGTILFYLDMDSFSDKDSFQNDYYDGFILITDEENQLIYCSSNEQLINMDSHFTAQELRNEKEDSYLFFKRTSKTTHMNYFLLLSREEVFGPFNKTILMLLVLFTVFAVIIFAIALKLSRSISTPLERLAVEIRQFGNGNFKIREDYLLETATSDDIRDICQSFIATAHKIDTLVIENYRVSLLQKDAQIKALQAQMDPHFLYNTLTSIHWLAKLNQVEKIPSLVCSLSALLRSFINTQITTTTLENELELVSHYINIQKIRFGDRLIYTKEIDPSMLSLPIPCLCLQPIIENSIKYALEPVDTPCEINIKIFKKNDFCTILLSDNGPGMNVLPSEKIISKGDSSGNGIGLSNIRERLQLLYGDSSIFSIHSVANKGTTIQLQIPIRKGD